MIASRVLPHCGAAVAQDGDAAFVVPVVQDALEHVEVAARRDRREEVPLHERAAVADPLLVEVPPCELEHAGPLEQDAPDLRTVTQDLRQERSVPPPTSTTVRTSRSASLVANSEATGSVRASMRAAALASTWGFAA